MTGHIYFHTIQHIIPHRNDCIPSIEETVNDDDGEGYYIEI